MDTTIPPQVVSTMPWGHVIHPNGYVQLIDKNGNEVPMLDMLKFVQIKTAEMVYG